MNRHTTNLFEILQDCEAMSAARIKRELRNFEVSVADDGGGRVHE